MRSTISSIKRFTNIGFLCLAVVLQLFSCTKDETTWHLDSPDHQIRVEISNVEMSSSSRLYYTIFFQDNGSYKKVMDASPLGIEREDTRFIENLELVSSRVETDVEDDYHLVSGKKLECHTSFNGLTLTFKNQNKQRMSLIFRAYNHGISFRYLFTGKTENNVRVIKEYTGFDFKEGNFWAHPYDTVTTWNPAYETYYSGPHKVGTEAPWNKNGWAFPILVESEGTWMLVSEAGFDGSYGASHLNSECDNGKYTIKFAEQGEAQGYYKNSSHAPLPWYTPWRFIVIGNSLSAVVETTLPTDLSAPSKIENTDWINPGRSSWSWWSDSDSPQDFEKLVPFVDFAAEMGWEYSLVDANWNRMKNGDLEKLADYAQKKDVGLLVWYNSGGKHNTVPEEPRDLMDNSRVRRKEFERISKMGIKGIKVDFFQSDKQEIIQQYTEILEDAAEFKLVVNFHGCTLPKGWRRTWPNLLTMEAVKGGECYRYDQKYPETAPSYLTILPFTRNAVGPADYTPGGFSDNTYAHLTTFGFELALPVIIESGIMHYMDTPEQTKGLSTQTIDFLKDIPVVWDDTKYITGYPGKDAVIARRSGDRWYIAGINGEPFEKNLTIDLSMTGDSPSTVEVISDGESARGLIQKSMLTSNGKLTVHMEPFGGFAGYWE